jgi:hypothetical protein
VVALVAPRLFKSRFHYGSPREPCAND